MAMQHTESLPRRRVRAGAFVSATEAAELTGLSSKTVRRWIAANRLHAVKQGRSFRISVSDLEHVFGRTIAASMTHDVQDDSPAALGPGRRAQVMTEPDAAWPAPTEATQLASLVRDLIDELVKATANVATLQKQCDTLTVELDRAQQAVREAERRQTVRVRSSRAGRTAARQPGRKAEQGEGDGSRRPISVAAAADATSASPA